MRRRPTLPAVPFPSLMPAIPDPFRDARQTDGVLRCPFQAEKLPMLLRHADVREAARDWQRFSSDAPFRVPIPSEEAVRSMRQLPIETYSAGHTGCRTSARGSFFGAADPPADPIAQPNSPPTRRRDPADNGARLWETA